MSEPGNDLSSRDEPAPPEHGPPVREPIAVDPVTREEFGPVSMFLRETWFSGPLPAPETLEGYERVLPGLSRRIVERWERESDHRQAMEREIVRSRIRNQSRGQIIGAVLAGVVLLAGIAFIADGKSTAGLVAILAPLAVLVGGFAYTEARSRRNGHE